MHSLLCVHVVKYMRCDDKIKVVRREFRVTCEAEVFKNDIAGVIYPDFILLDAKMAYFERVFLVY